MLLIILFFISVWAAPATLLAPSADSWYDAPAGYESARPGDILKYRVTPAPVESGFLNLNIKGAWQLMVRTENAFGAPSVVVSTVFEPFNGNSSRLLGYQAIEDAVNIDCSPSYAWLDGTSDATVGTQAEIYLIQLALNQGWYVVSPDYQGPESAYLVGRFNGQATLDAVRGALKSTNITGVASNASTALWGYSGGSVPTVWAASIQPHYAPDLSANFVGAALGGTVTNITATAVLMDGKSSAGQIAISLAGLSTQYPELQDFIYSQLNTSMEAQYNMSTQLCLEDSHAYYEDQSFFNGTPRYFLDGWDFFDDPYVQEVLANNTLAEENNGEIPQMPVFLYHGLKDVTVPIETVERVYDNWCDWSGVDVTNAANSTTNSTTSSISLEFAVNEHSDHYSEIVQGAPAAMAWLTARFNGAQPVHGCSRTDRYSNLFYPGVSSAVVEFVESAAKSLVGAKIGPSSLLRKVGE